MSGDSANIPCVITISNDADALYIQLASEIEKGEAVVNESYLLRSRPSEMVLDFNSAGKLLGIEIIGIEGLLKTDGQPQSE